MPITQNLTNSRQTTGYISPTSLKYNPINPFQTQPTQEPAPATPAVISSSLAADNKASFGSFLNEQKTGITGQADNVATNTAITKTQEQLKAEADAKTKAEADKLALEKKKVDAITGGTTTTTTETPTTSTTTTKPAIFGIATDKMPTGETKTVKDSKGEEYIIDSNGLIRSGPTSGEYKVGSNISNYPDLYKQVTGTDVSTDTATDNYTTQTEKTNATLDKASKDWQDAQTKLLNGTFPLNDLQKAQLASMQSDFESLIKEQRDANKQYEGAITQAGITSGRSRYAPEIEAGNVMNVVSSGLSKIAGLESKMRDSLAKLEAGFQTDNYKIMKGAYDDFIQAQKDKQTNLDKIHTSIAEALKQTQEQNQKVQDYKNDILKTLAESGAPADVIDRASSMTNIPDMLKEAGSYMLKGSGIIGEYNYYKADALSRGEDPLTFSEYQNQDANRKIAQAKASAFADGLTTSQSNLINTQNTFLSGQPIAKDLNIIQSKFQNLLKAIKQGGGAADIGIIYDFMKTLDPTSVVRETEYETGAKKSGNIFAGMFAKYNGYLKSKGGFISDSAKNEILTAIGNRYDTAMGDYKNLRNQVVDRLTKQGIPNADDYVIDYDNSDNIYNEATFTPQDLSLYLTMNPDKEPLALKVKTENPNLSDYEVWQLIEQM
jgi:hypothetical protein